MSDDLVSVIGYVSDNMRLGEGGADRPKVDVIGLSFGAFVVSNVLDGDFAPGALSAVGLNKVILCNPLQFDFKQSIQDHFRQRPATTVDEDGVWHMARADGSVTHLGRLFWESVSSPDQLEKSMVSLAYRHNTVLVAATDDDIVDDGDPLANVPFAEVVQLHGDHNYTRPEDRAEFLKSLRRVVQG